MTFSDSDYTRLVRYFRSAQVSLLLPFMGRYGEKTRLACIVTKAADIQWSKMLIVCNTSHVILGCSLTSMFF